MTPQPTPQWHAHSLCTAGSATPGAERRQHKHAELSDKYVCNSQQRGGCACPEQHLVARMAQWNRKPAQTTSEQSHVRIIPEAKP